MRKRFELTNRQYAALCHYVAWVNKLAPIGGCGKVEYALDFTEDGGYVWYYNRVVDGKLIDVTDVCFIDGLEAMTDPCHRVAFGMIGSDHARAVMGVMRFFNLISQDECLAICTTFGIEIFA